VSQGDSMAYSGDTNNSYTGNLNAAMKDVHDDPGIKNAYPESLRLVPLIGPLQKKKKVGRKFVWPKRLSFSQGHTYAAAGAGAFAFRQSRPGKTEQFEVDSTNHVHRSTIDYETLERTDDDKVPQGAYANGAKEMMKDLRTGMFTRVEESFLYGGTNLAVCQTATAGSGDDTGKLIIKVTYNSFAPMLWIGKEGAAYDFYLLNSDVSTPSSTLYNTNGSQALPDGSSTNAPLVLEKASVKADTRTLTFTGNSTDIAAIITAVANVSNKVGILYWGSKGNDTSGLDYCLTRTTGLYYGVNMLNYSLLRPNQSSNEDMELTLRRLYGHFDEAVSKGLNIEGMNGTGGLDVWLNPAAFRDMLSQETALRRYFESAGKEAKNGFGGLKYDSEVGPITFYSYGRIKFSESYILPTKKVCSKVGAVEPYLHDFNASGKGGADAQYLRQIEGVAACEAIMYGNLGFVLDMPAWCTKVSNIRPSNYAA
jgi:hypothetical protein